MDKDNEVRKPSQKQLLFILRTKAELMSDEMKDVLWTAYQNNRDHDLEYGTLELETWNDFLIIEKANIEKANAVEVAINEKILTVTYKHRIEDLEEIVAHLTEVVEALFLDFNTHKKHLDK